jgi:putative transposase
VEGNNSGNSRNGYNHKTIISDYGGSEIVIPRDRNGEFEPRILGKRQTRTDEIEQKIMAMYSKGMSQRDIEDNLREIYGADISQALISKITDKILPEVNEWQNRPLEAIYPIIYFDGIVFKSRKDSQIINKCVYSVLGIDMNGQKDILGIWISENEGASFYASICSDLKKRGVTDIFIACHDNLKGLGEAINAVFPKTKQQLCIVHQIRSSTKFVQYKDRKQICADLKKIYGAVNLDDAEYAKEEFREKWDKKYPSIMRSWDANWVELTTFFSYPEQIRRLIYTTNAVEAYHRMVRKFTKAKAIFPTDDSIRKVVFLSVKEIAKKWTQPARDWAMAYSQIMIFFADRFAA